MTELIQNGDFAKGAEGWHLWSEVFQRELDQRCKDFDLDDRATWPVEDGLYIGLTRETGRTGAIVLQWIVGEEPASNWRGVEVYIAVEDILPSHWTDHTRHTTQGEG